jgi:hypothetical protein
MTSAGRETRLRPESANPDIHDRSWKNHDISQPDRRGWQFAILSRIFAPPVDPAAWHSTRL